MGEKIWQLLSGRTNTPFAGARRSGVAGRNTLEDLLTGHYKNSHGVEGMVMGQMKVNFANRAASTVKEKVPSWTYGKLIPSDVLDEIFGDEGIGVSKNRFYCRKVI